MTGDHSEQNSRKLDDLLKKVSRLVQLIDGEGENMPGLAARVASIERVLFGKESAGGLVQQVQGMKRTQTWLMSTASVVGGAAMTVGVQYLVKHL